MPRTYKRISTRKKWGDKDMEAAILEVHRKISSLNAAALKYNIPESTLRKYYKKRVHSSEGDKIEVEFPQNLGRFKSTFTPTQVEELKHYVIDIDRRAFGLTRNQFADLCFDYAEKNGISHRFNKAKKTAGEGFIKKFMEECKLTMRKPESTSLARLMAFNKTNVTNFFDLLREVRLKYAFTAEQIYNVDETGFSTVSTKNPKVISPIGSRRVIKISSAERGVMVTSVCCMNATGNYIPPFFIYPRVRVNPRFLQSAPPGSAAVPHISGWMTGPNFVEYLKHFASHARPSSQQPVLLLMDNHASHVTLDAIQFSRDNGIVMLGFPPHTSHRLQPLDVGFYGPLKTAYSQACDDFLVSNPGYYITIHDIPKLFRIAYLKVATIHNAVNAFKATGIEPFDCNIFNDEDFQPALTTDIAIVEDTVVDPSPQPQSLPPTTLVEATEPTPSTSSALPPLPVIKNKTARKPKKKLPSLLLSGTPVKQALEQKRKMQEEKEQKRQKKLAEKGKKKKGTKPKTTRRLFVCSSSSDDESHNPVPYVDTDEDMDFDEDKFCIICGEEGKDEVWYNCFKCLKWAHAECAGWDQKQAAQTPYKCDFCVNK